MNFTSKELLNATEVTSLGTIEPISADVEKLKNDLKTFFLSKEGISLHTKFEIGFLNRSNSTTSTNTLKDYIRIYKEDVSNKLKNDQSKLISFNKLIDNIINTLDCISLLEIEDSNNNINALLLGYLFRNLLKN